MITGRLCKRCGAFFVPSKPDHIYCSERCRKGEWRRRHPERQSGTQKLPVMERPFCAWDGEGWDGKYTLLANSRGEHVYNPDGIGTKRALDFLLDKSSELENNVWFSFGYDVCMILGDVPLEGEKNSLEELYRTGKTWWRGYRLTYIPRKFFGVWRRDDGRRYFAYDVFGFFQSSYLHVLEEWLPGCEEIDLIRKGKEGREDFRSWAVRDVIAYNLAECQTLVRVMDRLRDAMKAAGLTVSRWDGAGAVAAAWLRREEAGRYYPDDSLPDAMRDPIERAYFGGRIELAAWGYTPKIFHYDINSAYPAALAECRDLSCVSWRHVARPARVEEPFALVHVTWDVDPLALGTGMWCPLPWRSHRGGIYYPEEGEGWYWWCEVEAAVRRCGRHNFQVLEAWVPEGPERYPLREVVLRDYDLRRRWKAAGNPAQYPLKLALNSLYGKMAQRVGMSAREPRWKNLIWAGWITARTRARLSDAIMAAGGEVVSTMTDSIWSLRDLSGCLPLSSTAGDWSFDPEEEAAAFVGAGLYGVWDREGVLREYKQRGFGGADVDYLALVRAWEEGGPAPDTYTLRRFVGIGLALHAPHKWRPHFRRMVNVERKIEPVPLVGTTKRLPDFCMERGPGGLWWQAPRPRDENVCSYPYRPAKVEEELSEEEIEDRLAEPEQNA